MQRCVECEQSVHSVLQVQWMQCCVECEQSVQCLLQVTADAAVCGVGAEYAQCATADAAVCDECEQSVHSVLQVQRMHAAVCGV
jgi:hypothetical protein